MPDREGGPYKLLTCYTLPPVDKFLLTHHMWITLFGIEESYPYRISNMTWGANIFGGLE